MKILIIPSARSSLSLTFCPEGPSRPGSPIGPVNPWETTQRGNVTLLPLTRVNDGRLELKRVFLGDGLLHECFSLKCNFHFVSRTYNLHDYTISQHLMPKQRHPSSLNNLRKPSVSDPSGCFLDPYFHFHRESTLIKSRLRVSMLKQKPCCLLGRLLSCGLCFGPAWEIPCIFDPSKSARPPSTEFFDTEVRFPI